MVKGTWGLLAGVIALVILAFSAVPTALNASYFPPHLREGSVACDQPGRPAISKATLEEDAQLYGPQWRRARERPLYEVFGQANRAERKSYRFSWITSGPVRVFVRVDATADGGLVLHATQIRNISSNPNITGIERIDRRLTREEQLRVESVIERARLATLAPMHCLHATDGQRWIIETAVDGRYIYVNRHSPDIAPIRAIGVTFLGLTGLPLEPYLKGYSTP